MKYNAISIDIITCTYINYNNSLDIAKRYAYKKYSISRLNKFNMFLLILTQILSDKEYFILLSTNFITIIYAISI